MISGNAIEAGEGGEPVANLLLLLYHIIARSFVLFLFLVLVPARGSAIIR